ncbi:MAG: hypothetical protein V1815_01115 [Candidatus Woesearchaeota archaeon]
MVVIESLDGTKRDINCIGCALQKGKIKRLGDIVAETQNFVVEQDYEIPIPGFLVISSKRHIIGFADFNENEKKEFIDLICKLRKSMLDALDIKFVNYLCREDTIDSKTNPSHFHMALLPIYDWMKKYANTIEILEYSKNNMKTKDNLDNIKKSMLKIRSYLKKL